MQCILLSSKHAIENNRASHICRSLWALLGVMCFSNTLHRQSEARLLHVSTITSIFSAGNEDNFSLFFLWMPLEILAYSPESFNPPCEATSSSRSSKHKCTQWNKVGRQARAALGKRASRRTFHQCFGQVYLLTLQHTCFPTPAGRLYWPGPGARQMFSLAAAPTSLGNVYCVTGEFERSTTYVLE